MGHDLKGILTRRAEKCSRACSVKNLSQQENEIHEANESVRGSERNESVQGNERNEAVRGNERNEAVRGKENNSNQVWVKEEIM